MSNVSPQDESGLGAESLPALPGAESLPALPGAPQSAASPELPCELEEGQLLDYLQGDLGPTEHAVLTVRLAEEPGLAERLACLELERDLLQSALAPRLEDELEPPPLYLAERILSALAQAPQASPTLEAPRVLRLARGRALRWAPLLAAAALLAGALLALQVTRPESPPQALKRQVRTSELLALGLLPEERS